jgi:branched-chain amino acid aminotransferase
MDKKINEFDTYLKKNNMAAPTNFTSISDNLSGKIKTFGIGDHEFDEHYNVIFSSGSHSGRRELVVHPGVHTWIPPASGNQTTIPAIAGDGRAGPAASEQPFTRSKRRAEEGTTSATRLDDGAAGADVDEMEEAEEVNAEIRRIEEKRDMHKAKAEQLKTELDESKEEVRKRDMEIERLTTELDESKQEVVKLTASLDESKEEVVKLTTSLMEARGQVNASTASVEEILMLTASLDASKQEIIMSKQEVDNLTASLEESKQEILHLTTSQTALLQAPASPDSVARVAELEEELQKCKGELEALKLRSMESTESPLMSTENHKHAMKLKEEQWIKKNRELEDKCNAMNANLTKQCYEGARELQNMKKTTEIAFSQRESLSNKLLNAQYNERNLRRRFDELTREQEELLAAVHEAPSGDTSLRIALDKMTKKNEDHKTWWEASVKHREGVVKQNEILRYNEEIYKEQVSRIHPLEFHLSDA